MPDSRKFCASISVRAGQEHSKIEIAPPPRTTEDTPAFTACAWGGAG